MSGNEPSEAEQAGLEAVRAVVDVTAHKRLVPSVKTGEKTGDWRVWTADGSIADVEVTRCVDSDARRFAGALSANGDAAKVWPDDRLSHKWTLLVSGHSSSIDGRRRLVRELMGPLCDAVSDVEAVGGTAKQMAHRARTVLIDPRTFIKCRGGDLVAARRRGVSLEDWCACSGYWHPGSLLDYLRGARHSLSVRVVDEPVPLGEGNGSVKTIACVRGSGVGDDSLVPAVQSAADKKIKKKQLDDAPDLKWLVVMLDSTPAFQLRDMFAPRSPSPHATLDVSFGYFDEVWAVVQDAESFVVLRLSDGGARQQHHVVSRSETAVSG